MRADTHESNSLATRRTRGERGFTLIEVMLSSAVLAVGLLGLAATTTLSFTRNSDGSEVTIATNLATEIIERMQFNRRNLVAGYDGINLTSNAPALCTQNAAAQPVARGDCLQWQARLFASGLLGVQAQVAVTAVGPVNLHQNNINVTVTWVGASRNTISVGQQVGGAGGTKRVVLTTIIAPEHL